MAFAASQSHSCPCLRTREVTSDAIGRRKARPLLARPGVRQVAAAAGDVAFVGELTDVQQQISLFTSQPVPQQRATEQQTHAQPTQRHVRHQFQQHNQALPLPVNGHHGGSVSGVESIACSNRRHSSSDTAYQDGSDVYHSQQLQVQQYQCVGVLDQQSLLLQQQDALQQQQQQQQLQDDACQQQHQHPDIEKLLSNASVSTANAVSAASSDRPPKQHPASRIRLQQHQQQWIIPSRSPQQLNHALDSSSSMHSTISGTSGISSSSRELSGQQLVRPNPAHVGARCASPAQVTAVAEILAMKPAAAQLLLSRVPQLLQLQPTAMQDSIKQLSQTLGVTYKQAAFMAARQPEQLLFRPAQEFLQAAQQLAVAIGLPGRDGSVRGARVVINAATDAPGLLVRPQMGLVKRLLAVSSWFGISAEAALGMAAAAPELLTHSWSGIQRRVQALRGILLLWPVAAQRLVTKYPNVLFLSPRIVNNKVKVLMAIMHKDRKAIGLLVYKTPELLQCDLERARICHQLLPLLLQRSEGFVYAMSAHSATVLLLPAPKLLVRGARILAALQMVPQWQQQWQQQRPPQIQEGLARRYQRFERLEYLVTTQQTDKIGVLEALSLKPQVFEQQFVGWTGWWSAKQQRLQQYQQQQRQQRSGSGRGLRSQIWPSQQQREQQQQQCDVEVLGLTPEQQQRQQQYQQLVNENLRQLYHKHRQRQMQHQQYRAQLLHQRTLQWQQLQQQMQQRQQHRGLDSASPLQEQQQQQEPLMQQQEQQQQNPPDQQTQLDQAVTGAVLAAATAAVGHYSGSSNESSSNGSSSSLHSVHSAGPAGASSVAAAAASVQHGQQLQQQQQNGSTDCSNAEVAAAAAESIAGIDRSVEVEHASAVAAALAAAEVDLSIPTVLEDSALASDSAVDDIDDVIIMPQQRQQPHWRRQQQTAVLSNGRRQQQQWLWQPAAVAKGV